MLEVKVIGIGCPNCLKVESLIKEVLEEKGIEARIEKVTEKEQFPDYGVFITPGLVVNNKVLVAGKIPTKHTLSHWIDDIINNG